MKTVAVLFAHSNSIYKTIPGCDVWDAERDARNWRGGSPVIAHPPCGGWGKLARHWKGSYEEKALAFFAVRAVRKWGGVLEHPQGSLLWERAGLPRPVTGFNLPMFGFDQFGGFTIQVDQHWWGHRARKRTWLYIRGILRSELPAMPLTLSEPTHVVSSGYAPYRGHRHRSCKPEISKSERELTPKAFAEWLVEIARITQCAPAPWEVTV